MKKILFSLIALCCAMSMNAQTVKLYKGETLVASYASDKVDKVVFEGDSKVSSITLNKITATLFKGSTTTLIATVLPDGATDKTVTWNTSNASVATVADGVVTAVEVGTANITATANDGSGVSATCAVTVTDDPSDSHEYVDLGLPSGVLWATCNVGAENIYDFGDYFAWGEIEGHNSGKTNFTKSTYKYYKVAPNDTVTEKDASGIETTTIIKHVGYTKYVRQRNASKYGYDNFYDNKTTLEASDDVATTKWGNKWRIPTQTEWSELVRKCTWTWCTLNGVKGYKVAASNGNYIFLPAASGWSGSLWYGGDQGYYWSSTLEINYDDSAEQLWFYEGHQSTSGYYGSRATGNSIRPVRSK